MHSCIFYWSCQKFIMDLVIEIINGSSPDPKQVYYTRKFPGYRSCRGISFPGKKSWFFLKKMLTNAIACARMPLLLLRAQMREWLSGGVSPCQGEGRGFESRLVLQKNKKVGIKDTNFFVFGALPCSEVRISPLPLRSALESKNYLLSYLRNTAL